METTRILLVDDDLCFLYLLRFVLEADGIKTEKATNCAEAVAALDGMGFDLIITDFNLPVINGVELAKIAKKRFPHIPIIMITGEIGPDIVEMAGKAGISRILYKPPNIEKLLATIRHFSCGGVSYGKITACG
jgi:CheY-like chemotaxis protein